MLLRGTILLTLSEKYASSSSVEKFVVLERFRSVLSLEGRVCIVPAKKEEILSLKEFLPHINFFEMLLCHYAVKKMSK